MKGNSLFAEVDDQRQQMRDLLQRQKQQYQMVSVVCVDIEIYFFVKNRHYNVKKIILIPSSR